MPAKSKAQQKFFGMVHAVQKGEMKPPSKEVAEVAKSISKEDAKDFAETKRKNLPEHKEKKEASTKELINLVTNWSILKEAGFGGFGGGGQPSNQGGSGGGPSPGQAPTGPGSGGVKAGPNTFLSFIPGLAGRVNLIRLINSLKKQGNDMSINRDYNELINLITNYALLKEAKLLKPAAFPPSSPAGGGIPKSSPTGGSTPKPSFPPASPTGGPADSGITVARAGAGSGGAKAGPGTVTPQVRARVANILRASGFISNNQRTKKR